VTLTTRLRLLALAIALCFLGATVALAFPRGETKQLSVTAYFSKAIGLFPHSKVRVLGVQIGTVTRVEPVGSKVRVLMKLDGERKIPADARAVIVPISLIADRYIQLTPVYKAGAVLKDGDVIDTDRTSIPVELDDVLTQLKKLLDAVEAGTLSNPESIGLAVKNLAAALAGAGEDLSKTLGGGGKLSSSITDNAAQLDSSIGHLSRLLAALAQRRSEIVTLNTRLAQSLGAIATEHATLDSALRNVALLTEQLGSLVKAHRPALTYDIGVLAKTTASVIAHQDSVVRSLRWLHVLADGADDAHKRGAVHITGADEPHIDVRDAHIDFPCPPEVPSSVCLLLALTGDTSLLSSLAPTGAAAGAAAGPGAAAVPAAQTPAEPDPANLLDLLPKVRLPGLQQTPASLEPEASPGLRGFFERLGGLVDLGVRLLW
jgi:virulence factor Mce-like protein